MTQAEELVGGGKTARTSTSTTASKATPAGGATETPADGPTETLDPVARWAVERTKVANRLQEEIKEIAATKNPLAGKAELELRAVLRQLSGQLSTKRQATEMERYLSDDEVVADVSEFAFDLKSRCSRCWARSRPCCPPERAAARHFAGCRRP